MARTPHTPHPWRFENGNVYGADGDVVADNVGEKDGPLVAAAPELDDALDGLVRAIERAAAAGIDLTGYVGVGDALRALAHARGEEA
jgi:hypothetical protein